jgi:hypothetical protein
MAGKNDWNGYDAEIEMHFRVKRHTQGLASVMKSTCASAHWCFEHSSPELSGKRRSKIVRGMWTPSHIPK